MMRTMMKHTGWESVWGSLALFVLTGTALGNNMKVTVLSLVDDETPSGMVDVRFNVAWDNSWRAEWDEADPAMTVANWDAAWVFVKWRPSGGEWHHATLTTGPASPAGTTIDVAGDKVGAFIYRSAAGSGSFSETVTLRWDRAADGASTYGTNRIDLSVHAVEMVYVAQGAFKVGTGGTEVGSFTDGSWTAGATTPFLIAGEGALTISNAAGCLWGTSTSGSSAIGGYGVLPAAFPKGYNAFYCMKYVITQGQYADFLNMLTFAQQATRCSATNLDQYMAVTGTNTIQIRNTVRVTGMPEGLPRVYTAGAPDRACNYLFWMDGAAYAAWAGLRPMTELEFEKACRGPLNPVAGEYAWGSTAVVQATSIVNDGTSDEAALPATANCVCGIAPGVYGPVRVGAFATANSDRVASGASYWGIMDLSGNVWERPVTVANLAGRSFTGLHGNGGLNASGDATVNYWPGINGNSSATTANGVYGGSVGVTQTAGTGCRGGNWSNAPEQARASERINASRVYSVTARTSTLGWRCVRTAP